MITSGASWPIRFFYCTHFISVTERTKKIRYYELLIYEWMYCHLFCTMNIKLLGQYNNLSLCSFVCNPSCLITYSDLYPNHHLLPLNHLASYLSLHVYDTILFCIYTHLPSQLCMLLLHLFGPLCYFIKGQFPLRFHGPKGWGTLLLVTEIPFLLSLGAFV